MTKHYVDEVYVVRREVEVSSSSGGTVDPVFVAGCCMCLFFLGSISMTVQGAILVSNCYSENCAPAIVMLIAGPVVFFIIFGIVCYLYCKKRR